MRRVLGWVLLWVLVVGFASPLGAQREVNSAGRHDGYDVFWRSFFHVPHGRPPHNLLRAVTFYGISSRWGVGSVDLSYPARLSIAISEWEDSEWPGHPTDPFAAAIYETPFLGASSGMLPVNRILTPGKTYVAEFWVLSRNDEMLAPGLRGVWEAPPGTTPEPASLALLGTGLVGVAFVRSRRRLRIGGEAETQS